MKWWKPLLIFLLCATPSWAGFWSDFPGVGPGTVLNDVIIDNSTINSSTLNQPIINDPTYNGTSTYNPGTVVNYDPSTIINGPNGSVWNYDGIYNLKNLTIAVGGAITLPPGTTLNLPDGSVWTDQGLSTLNIQAGGVITIGGVPAGGACPANQFYIALSSSLVPTCAPITAIPGPVTINQATFTGTTTFPDGTTWSVGGIFKSSPINISSINLTGALTFNGTAVGGTCPDGQWVYAISPTLAPVCSTPTGGGGGGTIPTPVSVANGGLGQGAAPSVGQILVANGPTSYLPVTMTGDATINSAGQITLTKAYQPLTSTSVTAPTNPIDGQFWFDPTTLQTYIWYTDPTSSQWVPVVNLTGATLTNPILNNATFTGTVTFPNGSIADSALAGSYSGTGACAAGLFVTGLNRNLPPTCNPAGVIVSATAPATPVDSQLWFNSTDLQTYLRYNDGSSTQWVPVVNLSGATLNNPTITNPIFLGTLQFPDGSYYDTNGHEVMKNLGVGVVAFTDGANAGSGTVYGNSIVVKGSGWDNTAAPHGYWDDSGLEQMYGLNSKWLDLGDPSAQVDGWGTIHGDANNAALNNPWAELDLTNQSAYAGGAMDTGYDQRWQAEGFEALNAIGIHQNTWNQGCTGVTVTTGITGAGAYLSDCAVAATASSFYDNVAYKIQLSNPGTGNNASVGIQLNTGSGATIYPTYMFANGPGNTANSMFPANSFMIETSEPNGMAIGGNIVPFKLNFTAGSSVAVQIATDSSGHGQLILPNTATSSIIFGPPTQINSSILAYGFADTLILAGGRHYDGTNWIADATTDQMLQLGGGSSFQFYEHTGNTVGSPIAPYGETVDIDGNGLTIKLGQLISYTNPSTNPTINSENESLTIPNGGNAPLPGCAGLVMVNDRMVNGAVCLYMVGHGTAQVVSQIGSWCVAGTGTPAAGTMSISFDGTTYRVYNNMGGQTVLGVFNVCTRTYPN